MPGGRNMIRNKGRVDIKYAKELAEMPDTMNDLSRATENRLGPFVFDKPDLIDQSNLIDKGPFELHNGAYYHGQWTKDGKR